LDVHESVGCCFYLVVRYTVVPKTKRVWSGEKNIMSKLLEPSSRLGKSEATITWHIFFPQMEPFRLDSALRAQLLFRRLGSPDAATSLEAKANVGNVVHVYAPIILNIEDPPPQCVESQILYLKI
jgi:hypothetical protein